MSNRVLYEERVKKVIETRDVGHFAQMYARDVTDLIAQADEREKHVTDLQVRGNQLIADQRDLKGLIRSALKAPDGKLSMAWGLEAQAMLERMK